ncbi:MAG: Flp1 family type IVb pilin [Kineothrix sp.]|nr:Flp1 family type IVb pilin [Kineothrix sp.]
MKTFLQIKKMQMKQILMKRLEELMCEEGDTNFVSIILIMVIVIAIAIIFQEQLTNAVQNVFGQLTDFIG